MRSASRVKPSEKASGIPYLLYREEAYGAALGV